ncbi:response regulator transcription factor [Halobacillus fulvus]|nr:response regulator transcription factor [Halobacillus fulvus]
MSTILIVDDEAKIRDVVASYLKKEGHEVIESDHGQGALKEMKRSSIDFVILDLMLPDISGEDVCRQIRTQYTTPVLMLTAKVGEKDLLNGLSIGADDYMVKPFSPRELVMRVHTIMRRAGEGKLLADSLSFHQGELEIDQIGQRVMKHGIPLSLTPIEYRLLVTLAKHPGRTHSREGLVGSVIGVDFHGDERTIDQHIKNLRHKIEPDPSAPTYIKTVYGTGYKFSGERS